MKRMTEKEAREAFRKAIGYDLCEMHWNAIKTVFAPEFAPEPVALPERLELDARGFLQPEGRFLAGCTPWGSEEQRLAGYEAARDRYNAYPGLRDAAQAVQLSARTYGLPQLPFSLVSCLHNLTAELAKGPK